MTVARAWEYFEVNLAMQRKLAEQLGWQLYCCQSGDYVFQRYAGKLRFKFVVREGRKEA